MTKKIIWVVVSCLMALSLVMASCGTAAEEEEEEEEAAAGSNVPQYGGVCTLFTRWDPGGFDPAVVMDLLCGTLPLTNDEMLTGDWTKGPAGTGETNWLHGFMGQKELLTGWLAESYEMPDDETIIFHIRPGVHYWDKAPANGREFTAEDAAWNIENQWAFPAGNMPNFFPPAQHLISATATDKYTLELKVPPDAQGIHIFEDGDRIYMMCKDSWDMYGNQADWKNALGTGPWILTDFIKGSSATFERNPDYWAKDPIGPGKGNQLPYMDGIKMLVLPDKSTQQAAFRSGKLEWMNDITIEDFHELEGRMHDFEYLQVFGGVFVPTGRMDKDLPFSDLRVRQALNLAVNQQELVDDYYEGSASIPGWPFYANDPGHTPFFTPLEEMDEITAADENSRCSAAELYTYNPDKARELLAEAGFPEGFKTKIDCDVNQVDLMSIIKEYYAAIGVDMEIVPHEAGIFNSLTRGRNHEEMIVQNTKMHFLPHYMFELRSDNIDCCSFYESPKTRAVYETINANLGRDDSKWVQPLKDITPYMIETAWATWMPVPHNYNVWQPWFKGYYGVFTTGHFTPYRAHTFTWIDTALKEKIMGD